MKAQSVQTPKLVVVIDDDPLVLEATGSLLESWGCDVVTADSYGTALTRLAEFGQRRPDLIVCDYRLSDSNGIEVIQSLRTIYEIPALLISGDPASPPDVNFGGGYRLLHKPLDASRFRDALVGASVLPN